MMLEPGTRLGPYEIVISIGAGGMGEVYRARDTSLKRDVAVKVLPAALAHDPERMARFRREAELLASLNHPGIATIYGLQENAIIMELVDGAMLAGPLPIDTTLQYARQIIDALEYAHDRGVIHRDLKPANIKVTTEGAVKLLDFGLAKAIEDPITANDPSNSPTLTLGHTRAGEILGTAAYMSPEQAVGKTADRRSDIFSFGAVLYELLTGARAFTGESAGETLAAVVKDEPDWSKLPPGTPEWLRGLLQRCLAKDRKQRLQAIGEARILLESPPQPSTLDVLSGARSRAWGWIAAAVMAAVAGASLWIALRPKPAEPRVVMHVTMPLPQDAVRGAGGIVLSPDGSRLAFLSASQRQIFVHDMDQLEVRALPGTAGAEFLCFSPDGQWISYVAGGRLQKVRVTGGQAVDLADAPSRLGPPTQRWEADGYILLAQRGALVRVPENGGKPETLATPDPKEGERFLYFAQLLPGGAKVLFSVNGVRATKTIALDLKTGERTVLLEGQEFVEYAPSGGTESTTGHLVYFDRNARKLMGIPFDAVRLRVQQAAPVPIGFQPASSRSGPAAAYSFSSSGVLAYLPDVPDTTEPTLVWVNRTGEEDPLPNTQKPYALYENPQISPDGLKAAVVIERDASLNADGRQLRRVDDIWVYEFANGSLTRITTDGSNSKPVWSAESKRVIYRQRRGALATPDQKSDSSAWVLLSTAADGLGKPTVLEERIHLSPYSVAPDNTLIAGRGSSNRAVALRDPSQIGGMFVLPLAQGSVDAKPRPFLDSERGTDAEFSPDGKWLAYVGGDNNVAEIYIVPYPGPGERHPVSTGGGTDPRWAANGRELFYRNGNKIMVVQIPAGSAFKSTMPTVLFEKPGAYGVARDGRFLMIKPPTQRAPEQPPEMHIIVNWFEELRRRIPPDRK